MKRSVICVSIGTVMLAACASPQPGTPAFTAQQEQKKQEVREEARKTSVDALPSWVSSPPLDEFSIYGTGSAVSSDLQFAEDAAILVAKRSLADRINSKLSSKMKDILTESGLAENTQTFIDRERTISNLITEVNLAGYSVTQKKFVNTGPQYRAYVLLQYPSGNANRILLDQINKGNLLDGKLRATKAFQELEEDVKKARATGSLDAGGTKTDVKAEN